MGYQTDFDGNMTIDPPLTAAEVAAVNTFCSDRHEPSDFPGYGLEYSYYCQWEVSAEGDTLAWDGSEKFYEYAEWLQYVIDTFIKPTGSVVNGDITWDGEESGDQGMLSVRDNVLTVKQARITYE